MVQNVNNDGTQPTCDDILSFFQQAVAWMNDQSYIQKYMSFGWGPPEGSVEPCNSMVNSDLSPTELGDVTLGI